MPVRVIALDQINPQIVSAGLNTAIIVWQDYMTGTNWDLYALKVTGITSGSTLWTAATGVRICIASPSNQTNAQAISDNEGGVIVAWQDDRDFFTNGFDIYSEHLNTIGGQYDGGLLDPDGGATCTAHAISTNPGNQEKPMLALKNSTMAICAWMDYRSNSNYDIYTTGTSGTLPVTLSALTASFINSENLVNIFWRTESEFNHLGYRIFRSTDNVLSNATVITASLLNQGTSIGTATEYSYKDTEIEANCTYNYWLESIEIDGSTTFYGPITTTTGDGQPQIPGIPLLTKLGKAYPNPFNPRTNISYTLMNDSQVKIEVYNMKGQKVKTLISKDHVAGSYNVSWDGTDLYGKTVSSGTYFYKMTSDNYSEINKMLLVK